MESAHSLVISWIEFPSSRPIVTGVASSSYDRPRSVPSRIRNVMVAIGSEGDDKWEDELAEESNGIRKNSAAVRVADRANGNVTPVSLITRG